MKTKIAGVALAAVVACGCVVEAEAAPFSVQIDAATAADGGISFTLNGDTRSKTASLNYSEHEQTADFLNFISTSFVDPAATIARSNVTTSTDSLGFVTNSATFTVDDLRLPYTVRSDSGASEVRKGYGFDFTLFQQVAPDGMIYQYGSSSSRTVLGSIYDPFSSLTTATGNPLSSVPLPATAPLFGATLLSLGALSYGMKRRGQPQVT